MARLDGELAVVAGGTGRVGEGLVRWLLMEGAQVVVPVRGQAREQRLRDYVQDIAGDRLHCCPAHLDQEDSVRELTAHLLKRFGRVDLAVACLGRWYYGYPLHLMPFDHWQSFLNDNLTTHFLFMQGILPLLHKQDDGMYVMINGSPAEIVIPDTGATSIAAAAQLMLSRVLFEEARTVGTRIYSLVITNPISTRDRGDLIMPDWVTPEDLGDYVTRLYRREAAHLEEPVHRVASRQDLEPGTAGPDPGRAASDRPSPGRQLPAGQHRAPPGP